MLLWGAPRSSSAQSSLKGDHAVGPNVVAVKTDGVRKLASRIAAGGTASPADVSKSLQDEVRGLSIRDAAELGTILMDRYKLDPRPWLALPHARERKATERVKKLQQSLGLQEPGFRYLEMSVRGPERLRKKCGDEMLTETIGVGFWNSYEGNIQAPSSFNDDDVDAVLDLPGLEWVLAEWSKLTDRGSVRLATLEHLREIRIDDTDVGDAFLQAIGENHEIRIIDVTQAKRITDEGVRALKDCGKLEVLELGGTSVTSESLGTLSRLGGLRELALGRTKVRSELPQLRALKNLRRLELNDLGAPDEPLSPADFVFLSELKSLKVLSLKNTPVTRITLEDMPLLTSLQLGHASLRDLTLVDLPKVGALAIATLHPNEPLRLRRLKIGGLSSLRSLGVQNMNREAADGLAAGIPTMGNLVSVGLSGETTDALANALGGLKQLDRLTISGDLNDAQWAGIGRSPRLSHLQVKGSARTSEGMRALKNAPTLSRLQLEDADFRDAGFLQELAALKSLRLDRCRIGLIDLSACGALEGVYVQQGNIGRLTARKNAQLKQVNLHTCRIGELTLDSCPSFQYFFCGSNARLDRVKIRNLPALTSLTFQEGTSLGALRLKRLPSVKDVTFWAAKIEKRHIEALKGLPLLKRLDLSGTTLGADVAEAAAELEGIEELDAGDSFDWEGLEKLSKLKSLKELKLYHGEKSEWTPEAARRLFSHVAEVSVF